MSNKTSSKIEQTIDEIEDFIENCKFQPFSNSKIIVDKDEMDSLLSELRHRTPDEIKRYQKVLNNQERILADAEARAKKKIEKAEADAKAIVEKAEVHTTELISKHQIMQQAYAKADEVIQIAANQAQEIMDNATNDANSIRIGAIQYTDDMLNSLEEIIATTIETTTARTENLLASLQACYEKVRANRGELAPDDIEMMPAQEVRTDLPTGKEPPREIQMTDIN